MFVSVSRYTREAGVRNLDRRLAAICRAVAVKVAEVDSNAKQEKLEKVENSDKKEIVNDNLSDSVSQDASALAHPPEMPIVVDEVAVEDILGVRTLMIFIVSAVRQIYPIYYSNIIKTPKAYNN